MNAETYGLPWTKEDYFHKRLDERLGQAGRAWVSGSVDLMLNNFQESFNMCRAKLKPEHILKVEQLLRKCESSVWKWMTEGQRNPASSYRREAGQILNWELSPSLYEALHDANFLLPAIYKSYGIDSLPSKLGVVKTKQDKSEPEVLGEA